MERAGGFGGNGGPSGFSRSGAAGGSDERKRTTGETIHSGQFMVSHFETEGQEDEDDDDLGMQVVVEDVKPAIVDTVISNIISKRSGVQMDPVIALMPTSMNAIVPLGQSGIMGGGLSELLSSGSSTDLIRFAQKHPPLHLTSRYTSSQVEIDTDLSKVFNTLNVTYTQKLTSPKWNPFKGIRLRWKEKIRLNNVIWRCWHMQFIMKRKTLVCQFASPLDVDVHNTPQAILLEGKYWKRKCNVIKAEYKKWRRFYVNRALGATNIVDTASELDFLEWSPTSNEFMIADNMSTDTLLSTLSQYPFPDSREIARGAGRADFIQPSLGPLQPNFDDLMDLELDFLNFPRLAPVPEEGSEDILKAIDYNYPSCTSQMNSSSSIQEITDTQTNNTVQNASLRPIGGTNTVITGPVASMNVDQQHQQQSSVPTSNIHYTAKIFTQNLNAAGADTLSSAITAQQQQQQLNNVLASYLTTHLEPQSALQQPLVSANVPAPSNPGDQRSQLIPNEELNKEIKPKFPRAFAKLGREPHNYDKCPPTTHQTMAYNLVSQPHLSHNILHANYPSTSGYQAQPGGIIQMSGTPSSSQNLLSYNQLQNVSAAVNPMNLSNSVIPDSNSTLLMQNMNSKLLTHSQSLPVQNQPGCQQKPQPRSNSMPTAQNYPPISPPGGIHQQHQQDVFKGSLHPTQTSSYKSYHHQPQPYKIPSQSLGGYSGGGRSMRHASPPHGHQTQHLLVQQQPCIEQPQQQLQDLQLQQQQKQQISSQQQQQQKRLPPHPTKEMFRSNSLPINATFPLPPKGEENFAVPRFQAKQSPSAKLRSRSNSMIMKQGVSNSSQMMCIGGTNLVPALHSATSEPTLNMGSSALLAQLLTTNSASALLNVKQQSTSSGAIGNLPLQQQHQQQQSHQQLAQHQQLRQQPLCQQLPLGSPISPSSSQSQLASAHGSTQQGGIQQHQLPTGTSSSHSSVLTFAGSPSAPAVVSSPSATNISSLPIPEAMSLDTDSPMLSIESGGNSNSSCGSGSGGGGVGNKFHQQQARNDSQRRSGHIHAEQKRRYNIKNGFDMLHSLIPQLQQNPNAKLSKAAMLQKGAEYIKQLRQERAGTNEKMDALRREIDALNNSLNNLQTALPASGAPVSRQRTGRVKELYQQYVLQRTLDNWKFWIFGLIFEPLMNTFNQTVSVASLDEMCRTSQLWVDQHCSLVELRPAVSNKLRQLSTTTDILSDPPTSLQEEVLKAISTSLPLPGSSSGGGPGSSSSRSGSNPNSPNRNASAMQ